jgi:peroxiredoxin
MTVSKGPDQGGATVDFESSVNAAEQEWLEHWQRGPQRRRWDRTPAQIGDPAPDFELPDSSGRSIRLNDFWGGGPALLLFWRHFGCGCGLGRAERLRGEYPKLVEAGARVAIVGQGEPERAARYAETFQIPCPILCDPEERAYRAYGLLEMSPWLLLGKPRPDTEYLHKVMQKHREMGRPAVDNPFLLPGEFVISSQGRLVLTYRYHYCDNYPDPEALLESIREASSLSGDSVKD